MKRLVVLLLGFLFVFPTIAEDRYLELRRNANAYEEPSRESDVVAQLKPKSGSRVLLKWSGEKENGYYLVNLPNRSAKSGWVYKAYLRGSESVPSAETSTRPPKTAARASESFGDCKSLFVGGKAPVAPHPITPLCEDEDGVVFFASGYSKEDNRGYWSAYRLDKEHIEEIESGENKRPKITFKQNQKLKDGDYVQPRHDSYTGTDWDRGHLAPNGAMAWDEDAQRRSFLVSNIAPQDPKMNRNIWRCFEHTIREWAVTSESTYVVVGTVRGEDNIWSDRDPNTVEINVPSHFLVMVYRSKPSPMAIGAMVPNTSGNRDIRKFLMPVAELEQKSGFKFGLPAAVANQGFDAKRWPTRIVKIESLGNLKIDQACPKVGT